MMEKYPCRAYISMFATALECVIMEVKILGINYSCFTKVKISEKPVQSSTLD